MSTKFNRLDDALEKLAQKIEKSKKDYTLEAAKHAEGVFKARVFGYGSKDVNGASLPVYSKKYAEDKNKRSSTWDLQDSLDLRNSIQVVTKKRKKRTVLQFTDDKQLEKAEGLEKRSGQTIFEVSEKEKKEILDFVKKEILRDLKKAIKESFK